MNAGIIAATSEVQPKNGDRCNASLSNLQIIDHATPNVAPDELEEDDWRTHPLYKDYECNRSGEVRNKQSHTLLVSTPNQRGYVSNGYKCPGKKTCSRYRHRFVYEAFFGLLAKGLQIDHRNGVRNDNRLCNLEALTAKQHARKTARTTLEARVDNPIEIATAKAVWRVSFDETNIETERVSFSSAKDAASKTPGCKRNNIQQAINKSRLYNGYFWEYIDDASDQHDEIWETVLSGAFTGLKVSSMGRLQMPYGKTFGNPSPDGYRSVVYNNVSVRVHIAVCIAFHGPAPHAGLTVDHIDQQHSNNIAGNLRWATAQTQAENKNNSRAVTSFVAGTEIMLNTYSSCKAAYRATGVNNTCISKCCRGKQQTAGQHSDGRRLTWRFAA